MGRILEPIAIDRLDLRYSAYWEDFPDDELQNNTQLMATLETISGYAANVQPQIAGFALAARRVMLSNPPENGTIWTAECPSLRGCISQGETPEDALENIREAMELWLEVALERGDYIPSADAL